MSLRHFFLAMLVIGLQAVALASEPSPVSLLSETSSVGTAALPSVTATMPVKAEANGDWLRVAAFCAGAAAVASTLVYAVSGLRKTR